MPEPTHGVRSIRIPHELWRALQAYAAARGVTSNRVVVELIRELVTLDGSVAGVVRAAVEQYRSRP